jgi:hypothetical protein
MDCFASLAMTWRVLNFNQPNVHTLAAPCPSCATTFSPKIERAQGMPGAGWHPRSRVQDALRNAHTSMQGQPKQPGIPRAMVLRFMPRSPWRRIPLASIANELTARIARLGFANLRRLDASNGRQDHTVLPYASAPFVRALCPLTVRPSGEHTLRADAAASTATCPNVATAHAKPPPAPSTRSATRTG